MKDLFKFRSDVTKEMAITLEVIGVVLFLLFWHVLYSTHIISESLLPSPIKVILSFPIMLAQDHILYHMCYSLLINFLGYLLAVVVAIPLAFLVGPWAMPKNLAGHSIDAVRFIPLTAITGLFIGWFGIGMSMKVYFLAFGIFIYLLPVTVSRILDPELDVYQDTAFTLGLNKWQMIRYIFFPIVMSKVFEDIKVLVAISWTYIVCAELLRGDGGLGFCINQFTRQNAPEKVFAVLFIIVMIGFFQDKILSFFDRIIFKFKHIIKQ